MFTRRPPALPERSFPLLLRPSWRVLPDPRLGRLRALACIANTKKTARPAPYRLIAAE